MATLGGATGGSQVRLIDMVRSFASFFIQAWPSLEVREDVRHSVAVRNALPLSVEIGALATLGSTTGDSRVKYQSMSVDSWFCCGCQHCLEVTVVSRLAWRSQADNRCCSINNGALVVPALLLGVS